MTYFKATTRQVLEYSILGLSTIYCLTYSSSKEQQIISLGSTLLLPILCALQERERTFVNRKSSDGGLWMILALPIVLAFSGFNYAGSGVPVFLSCCTTVFSSITIACNVNHYLRYLTILVSFCGCAIFFKFDLAVCSTILCAAILFELLNYQASSIRPSSFSFGELHFLLQSITVFVVTFVTYFMQIPSFKHALSDLTIFLATIFLSIIFFGVSFVISRPRSNISLYVRTIIFMIIVYVFTHWAMNKEPIYWLISTLLFHGAKRVLLLSLWLGLLAIAVIFAYWFGMTEQLATSSVRKVFHGFVIVVYTLGTILDPHITFVASGCIFGVFVLLEMYRLCDVDVIGRTINAVFTGFLDEKDSGVFILSHIYLLVGCALPFFVTRDFLKPGVTLALMTGVITLGFGDTVAAIVGSRWGSHYLPGVKKTWEGTLASVLIEFLVCALFAPLDADWVVLLRILYTVCLVSGLEATTLQVDNIAVPLVAYPLFMTLCTVR